MYYNKHFPLEEFFLYNGSFSTPPCEENVTYIINPKYIYAPIDQIMHLSKVIIMNGNLNGNKRSIQSKEKIEVFHFQQSDALEISLNYLDLFNKKNENLINEFNVKIIFSLKIVKFF